VFKAGPIYRKHDIMDERQFQSSQIVLYIVLSCISFSDALSKYMVPLYINVSLL